MLVQCVAATATQSPLSVARTIAPSPRPYRQPTAVPLQGLSIRLGDKTSTQQPETTYLKSEHLRTTAGLLSAKSFHRKDATGTRTVPITVASSGGLLTFFCCYTREETGEIRRRCLRIRPRFPFPLTVSHHGTTFGPISLTTHLAQWACPHGSGAATIACRSVMVAVAALPSVVSSRGACVLGQASTGHSSSGAGSFVSTAPPDCHAPPHSR